MKIVKNPFLGQMENYFGKNHKSAYNTVYHFKNVSLLGKFQVF